MHKYLFQIVKTHWNWKHAKGETKQRKSKLKQTWKTRGNRRGSSQWWQWSHCSEAGRQTWDETKGEQNLWWENKLGGIIFCPKTLLIQTQPLILMFDRKDKKGGTWRQTEEWTSSEHPGREPRRVSVATSPFKVIFKAPLKYLKAPLTSNPAKTSDHRYGSN